MTLTIPSAALVELRNLMTASAASQQRVIDFGRACALMLGLDADDPALKFDAHSGTFEVADPSPATPLAGTDTSAADPSPATPLAGTDTAAV